VLVHVNIVALGVPHLAKSVHVELPDEGGEVLVLEVPRENVLGESGHALDIEGIPSCGPPDHRLYLRILCYTQSTYTISSSLLTKSGREDARFFLLFIRFMTIYYTHESAYQGFKL
jgi:hypothetical protein